jgi:hypothetical protein
MPVLLNRRERIVMSGTVPVVILRAKLGWTRRAVDSKCQLNQELWEEEIVQQLREFG